MRNSGLLILIVALMISLIGVSAIYSSTYNKEAKPWEDVAKRQILWIGIGMLACVFVSNFNYRKLWDVTYFMYFFSLGLLIFAALSGITRLGAQRWISFGWFNFQPSEFAKFVSILFLARYFSMQSVDDVRSVARQFGVLKGLIIPFIYIAIPMLIIMDQPDLGSALMIFFIFILIVFISGVKMRYISILVLTVLCLLPVGWHFLRDYQRDRLMVFINPNIDPLGAGYTIIQSKIAIGSGALFGKGWLSGTQSQLHFLPESHTDFIFATFAEEWGFLGALILFMLYFLLIKEGINIGLRTRDYFGKLLAFGISSIIAIQIFINVAMTLGLAPVVGLPLPLMSYGGSSVLITFILLGILINIDKTRTVF
ncbi:MAG: rod shape-determining protein RodA [Candidatus Omnitrophota bacterium]|jgi:rod shape determining protein RodA|nr:MAG: rod shape-determining protein RodA [Candidatus Omnitrophota bacterium]